MASTRLCRRSIRARPLRFASVFPSCPFTDDEQFTGIGEELRGDEPTAARPDLYPGHDSVRLCADAVEPEQALAEPDIEWVHCDALECVEGEPHDRDEVVQIEVGPRERAAVGRDPHGRATDGDLERKERVVAGGCRRDGEGQLELQHASDAQRARIEAANLVVPEVGGVNAACADGDRAGPREHN